MPECKHEIEESTCGDCKPRPRRVVVGPLMVGPWVTASYDGHCAGCDDEIKRGSDIRSDGEGGWLCLTCGTVKVDRSSELWSS